MYGQPEAELKFRARQLLDTGGFMTRRSIVTVAALLTMGTIPSAQERQVGGVGLTMFADSNFAARR